MLHPPLLTMSLTHPDIDSGALLSVVEHVFLPPKLPQEAQTGKADRETNMALCHILLQVAATFHQYLLPSQEFVWTRMERMIKSIQRAATASPIERELGSAFSNLVVGDVFVMHIREQNAAVVIRVLTDCVRFEMFEVSPPASTVMSTNGKLLCSYPGPAVEVSPEIFANKVFLGELASFLIQMDIDVLDSTATTVKAGSTVREVRESAHPKYISELLVGILRGFGRPASVDRITKRIGDEVLWKNAGKPWRRSPLWLVIRVALQTSLNCDMYKTFVLFFHAHLLKICVQRDFPSETLHLMRIKMARRLSKLGLSVSDDICQVVHDVAQQTEKLLQSRWTSFQMSCSTSPPWHPDGLDFVGDSTLTLKNSRRYLTSALSSTSRGYSQKQFNPSHQPRLADIVDFSHFADGRLKAAVSHDKHTALADFESSVERHIDHWVDSSQHDDDAPDVIASCVEQYFTSAREIYGADPEENSVMILTIMDLWKALDTLTIRQCPLLRSYSPEIPRDFLHPLLLHRSGSLRRAKLIEKYIFQRHEEASYVTSIFSDKPINSSFAVQYFCSSPRLQRLYADIYKRAQREREKKRTELEVLNKRSQSLKDAASRMQHTCYVGRGWYCEKCQKDNEAEWLKISVHEWPLPGEKSRAQSVIFELSPPSAFSAWREITYKILCDIAVIGKSSVHDGTGRPKLLLDTFSGLKHWAVRHIYHRITIASTTKSFSDQTHYKNVRIPADESAVLLNNGLSFKLFDRTNECWAEGPFASSIANTCAPPIPVSPYSKIHSFVSGVHHTSNEVIAAQADCPPELSLHEYMAFSGLRSGPRLQWLNIARELPSPSLSFRREEVHTLITQTAWHLGPLSDGVREWHTDLDYPSFGRTLLQELEALLGRIENNWQEEVTVRTIVLLTSRLLSSARDPDICEKACTLLRKARSVTHRWIGELGSKLATIDDEMSYTDLHRQLCVLAATCFSIYDVCTEQVPWMLSSDSDFAIAVHCAVTLHDNTPSTLEGDDSGYLTRLLNRHRRLLHFLEPNFHQCVQSNPSGLDQGLASLWPGFCRKTFSNWHILPSPNSRWISCIETGGQEVHLNLLTGQLLIKGNPLGRLPQEITGHSTYIGVLGTRILDVIPANISGMDFMTRSTVLEYWIYFSLRDGGLTLQARPRQSEDPRLLQLVPRAVLVGDFPKAFVDDYVHWLDLRTGEVEFRPVKCPWTSHLSNWRLHIHTDDTRSMFRKIPDDGAAPVDLIDVHSATFRMISRLLSALESPEHVIITSTNKALEASLSRLCLVFFVNQSLELECRSMPGYVIDKLQSCGTMFGLKNQLVLCPSNRSSEMPRRVIIPQGDVVSDLKGDFSWVSIETGTARRVIWHEYTIDTDLERLTGVVSLRSKLYQCYLHALTSHCLPDPLLGHTGTEESLHMLQSAAFLSFQRLDEGDAKLLDLISNMTPPRVYYPPHLQSMVTVEWKSLLVLSQHHNFHPAVLSILGHAHVMEALYGKPVDFQVSPQDPSLLKRTASRTQVYYPHDLQNSRHSSSSIPDDVVYESRDIVDERDAECAAYQMSCSIWNDRPCLSRKCTELWDVMQSWRSLGPAEKDISLRYSRYWLTFNAAEDWLGIYDICQEALNCDPHDSKIRLAFSLSAANFSGTDYADIIPLVQIFATDPSFRGLTRPPEPHYELSDGTDPDDIRLETLMFQSALPLQRTPAQTIEVPAIASKKAAWKEREREYNKSISENTSTAARSTMEQWPKIWCDLPPEWFDTQSCKESIDAYQQSVFRNISFKDHVCRLQANLNHYEITLPPNIPYMFCPRFSARSPKAAASPSLRVMLMSPPQPSVESNPPLTREGLGYLIQGFRNSRGSLLRLYGDDLQQSYSDLLQVEKSVSFPLRGIPPQEDLRHYRDVCSRKKDALFSDISGALAPVRQVENVLSVSGLWPRITPRSILRELSRDRIHSITDRWKHVIIRYAVAFLKYQQSQRLLELSSGNRDEELLREAETACKNVAEACSPDWLLIQIDANFLARQLQLDIAREMISPLCQRSSLLQLNMGEGKSSVIVPLVAATLADGSHLVRIVTLKPLSNQMFQLLLGRLSGLADRRIFYVPFSRSLQMDASVVQRISTLYKQCVDEGGILVVQPEHILSQKLMCITLLTSCDDTVAKGLNALQDWLAKVSRDVLDESDEILHVRHQLIYTAGEPSPVEDHPNRWSTTQQVFGRLQEYAEELHDCFPQMFELGQTEKRFPRMRVLSHEVSRRISSLIAEDALGGALSTLSLDVLSPPTREATRRFITQKDVSIEDHELIRSRCAGTRLWGGILLLRGLLVDGDGILSYVLMERQWRVDYGLDPRRTLLAVPFLAKDVPSLRAEFGHPDVAIALTCLSYYYGGLTKEQVLQCFDLLTKFDNPDMEYDQWVKSGKDIPYFLQQINGVNTKDDTQIDGHLVPLFLKNTKVIDFYLSQVVFPRAAKEFTHKLSTSAWDLVEDKSNLTTGFSGTNDNRYLLPTSITQEDPVSQLSTNALVLQYLLQPENNHYECTESNNGERESAGAFLQRLTSHDPEIRVLLDVGAQMLELQNEELVRNWLSLRPQVSAAIFFNESDILTVRTQDGTTEPFTSSPFNRQLDKCVVYLDDVHTRGTDLKLPRGTRAAVTLGPKVTKDRLLQGCMRMRQLGKGQSVMFFAPGEVDRRIRDLIQRDPGSQNAVGAIDILRWAMHETCEDISHHLPQWAQQGVDHHWRFSAYEQYRSTGDLRVLKSAWSQRESRTLEEMYEPVSNAQGAGLDREINNIPSLRERLDRLGVTQLTDSSMAEEQEREVNYEVEREHQVERPSKVLPATHIIHDDILTFVRTGKLPEHSTHIVPLFAPTDIDKALDSTIEWSPSPLATADFATTTEYSNCKCLTDYLRPVNWVVSSGSGENYVAIVISPYEANELLPIIRKSDKVRLHIYAPRVTASMRSFSDFTYHTVPESPTGAWTAPTYIRMELNLFAGQLYFDSKEEYDRVCELFALHMAHPGAKHIEVDGFVRQPHRTGAKSPFSVSVIARFKELTGFRRKGMGYNKTHLGRVLDARSLSSEFGS
ncbi:hypothetical protein EDB83DRAFT_804615 [Lactarius deliciosus]|nr:hypothetical protein EDB83DRAFT_804615 [Lactarius deliciosus]